MMTVYEYASDMNRTVDEILNLCQRLEIKVSDKDDLLSDDDISSINDIYNTFIEKGEDDKSLAQLNSIFSKYILT